MNTINMKIAGIALLAVASSPAHSMSWNNDAEHNSNIETSPLVQQAYDALWVAEEGRDTNVFKPIKLDKSADFDGSQGNEAWK